jgi:hypothetical protein
MSELRLGLNGRALVFSDGPPYCLVCGRRPFATRSVAFSDPEFAARATEGVNTFLRFIHPMLANVNRWRLVSFEVDAPVCLRHYWRGRWGEIGAIALFILAIAGFLALGIAGKLPKGATGTGSALKALFLTLSFLGAYLLWKRSRPPRVLPCEARRETAENIIFTYPDGAPTRRFKTG